MKAPTLKAMRAFWEQHPPHLIYRCADCGKEGQGHYIQPQHPHYAQDIIVSPTIGVAGAQSQVPALCTDCITTRNRGYKEKRKAALATALRCEISGCTKRQTWTVAGVDLCGWHKTKAIQGHGKAAYNMGPFGLFASDWFDRNDVLRWAAGESEVTT